MTSGPSTRPPKACLIEWGWLLAGPVPPDVRAALDQAREIVIRTLEAELPRFDWALPLVLQDDGSQLAEHEPVALLREASQQREARGWDFALIITPLELRTYYKSYALAVPSSALGVSLLSLSRLAPAEDTPDAPPIVARRVAALALHLLGDLNGLWHRDDPGAVMYPPGGLEELDEPRTFSADELEQLGGALDDVADLRLEEVDSPGWAPWFYLRATGEQLGEIARSVLQARPWEFPLRLSRLTAAALSALFLLLLTAEVWDLGTSQPAARIATLSAIVIGATTAFILVRQKLILRRTRRTLTERVVAANVSAFSIVFLGMCTTYALLFVLVFSTGVVFYGPELIQRWAPSVGAGVEARHFAVVSGLVASLGLMIGSLGASFEGNHYFQHVIYADEET